METSPPSVELDDGCTVTNFDILSRCLTPRVQVSSEESRPASYRLSSLWKFYDQPFGHAIPLIDPETGALFRYFLSPVLFAMELYTPRSTEPVYRLLPANKSDVRPFVDRLETELARGDVRRLLMGQSDALDLARSFVAVLWSPVVDDPFQHIVGFDGFFLLFHSLEIADDGALRLQAATDSQDLDQVTGTLGRLLERLDGRGLAPDTLEAAAEVAAAAHQEMQPIQELTPDITSEYADLLPALDLRGHDNFALDMPSIDALGALLESQLGTPAVPEARDTTLVSALMVGPGALLRIAVLYDNIDEEFWFAPLATTCDTRPSCRALARCCVLSSWELLCTGPLRSAETRRLLSCSVDFTRLQQCRAAHRDG